MRCWPRRSCVDTLGNVTGLYDEFVQTDDVFHTLNWVLLVGAFHAFRFRNVHDGRDAVLLGYGFGALAIVWWELLEWAGVRRRHRRCRWLCQLTYGDTIGDLLLSSTGGLIGSLLAVRWLGPPTGSDDPARGRFGAWPLLNDARSDSVGSRRVSGTVGATTSRSWSSKSKHILPTVNDHFDSMWVADHFWGFDAKTDPFVEAWTSLTWLAAKFPDVPLCHHVLGHGYRPPALTEKMAATLQVFWRIDSCSASVPDERGDEYLAYGYEFPSPSVRYAQIGGGRHDLPADVDRGRPELRGHLLHHEGAAAPPLPEVVPPVCIESERRADRVAPGRPDRRHVAQHVPQGRRLAAQVRHRAACGHRRRPRPCRHRDGHHDRTSAPRTDTESAELHDIIARWNEVGVDHVVMDFGNPASTEPILRFAEQVIAPLR